MAVSEAARSNLYNSLHDALGPDNAETLMSVVSFHELDEVATKRDIQVLGAELRAEMAELRAELKAEINGEIGSLRKEISGEMGSLRKMMTNWMLTVLVTVIGAMVSLALLV